MSETGTYTTSDGKTYVIPLDQAELWEIFREITVALKEAFPDGADGEDEEAVTVSWQEGYAGMVRLLASRLADAEAEVAAWERRWAGLREGIVRTMAFDPGGERMPAARVLLTLKGVDEGLRIVLEAMDEIHPQQPAMVPQGAQDDQEAPQGHPDGDGGSQASREAGQ